MTHRPSILLFNPATWRGVGDTTVPWGLVSLATRLGHLDIHLVDQRFDPDWPARVRQALAARPLFAGATAMTGLQLKGALEFFRLVKEESDTPTVMGGVHASMLPAETAAHPAIDYVLAGEAEHTVHHLCRVLAAGDDPREIVTDAAHHDGIDPFGGGLVWEGHSPTGHPVVRDLPDLPLPPHGRFPMLRYVARTPYGRTLSVVTSRGCPHGCAFCIYSNPHFKTRYRALSPDRTRAFMDELARAYAVDHFHIQDDNFFVSTRRVEAIVEHYAAHPPPFTWTIGGAHIMHLKRYGQPFFHALKRAGCTRLLIGAESGSETILERIGKHQTTAEVLHVNGLLVAAGIRPIYSFISGVPGERDVDLLATVQLMDRLRRESPAVDVGTVKPLVFYPGTEFYRWALQAGFVPPRTVEGWVDISWDHYLELPYPWLSPERRRFLVDLYYVSLLWNPHYHWVNSRLFTAVARALMPLTRYRMTHLDFRGSVMPDLLRFVQHRALS